jgi:8-oxo-dGTP pyrophosphatase MutT (NUDIX family)
MLTPDTVSRMPWTNDFVVTESPPSVHFTTHSSHGTSIGEKCSTAFGKLVSKSIDDDIFEVLNRRHSEYYRVIGANYLCSIERFSSSLFGIVERGAHLTAYTITNQGLRIWVPRRARHLFTYPSKLDSTVAGGVKATDDPSDCIVSEALEEASLPESLVKSRIRASGALSYITTYDSPSRREVGLISPQVLFIYDLELPPDITPTPNDDEVEEFRLMSVEEITEAMYRQEFKTNSAVVMIDFFIRHGILTSENCPNYLEILSRTHRRLPLATEPEST